MARYPRVAGVICRASQQKLYEGDRRLLQDCGWNDDHTTEFMAQWLPEWQNISWTENSPVIPIRIVLVTLRSRGQRFRVHHDE